jgi:hypothetical protein
MAPPKLGGWDYGSNDPGLAKAQALSAAQKFKPVHFEWTEAEQHAKRRYRP